ncbi:hypothetical protein A2956_03760 [Candidatus Roizmanbacteria bacterium RIFCSPLOWO2_01_FULL_37_57]|nr:MAG: hypothetical protein A2956_03760 [Candidatus Roizmanbacteria bacterium RIFCSPLOWO2_01_FULL_37_57]
MQKIFTFIHALQHSLVPLDNYYKKILKKTPLTFSVKYLFALLMITSFIISSVNISRLISSYPPQKLAKIIVGIEQNYPEDLIITINKNARLTTNYDRPYTMYVNLDGVPTPIFVVDPKAQPEKIASYGSPLLMTEQEMVITWEKRALPIPYEKGVTFIIDKAEITSITTNLMSFVDSYYLVIVVLFIVMFIGLTMFFFIGRIVYLAIISLIAFLIGIHFFKKLTVEKTYQISLHASTGPILLELIVIVFGLVVPIPFWFFLLTLVFVIAAIYEAYIED